MTEEEEREWKKRWPGSSYKMTSPEPYMGMPTITKEEQDAVNAAWLKEYGTPYVPPPMYAENAEEFHESKIWDTAAEDRKNEEEVRVRREARLQREREEAEKNSQQ